MEISLHTEVGGKPGKLSKGPHLFTDWRYIETGKVNWLSEENKPMELYGDFSTEEVHGESDKVPRGIRLAAQKAKKIGPIKLRSTPYEYMLWSASIIHEDGKYRMWYTLSLDMGKRDVVENVQHYASNNTFMHYAESDDCINWHKPSLKLVNYRGSNDNNIIGDFGGAVFKDPSAPAEERYKIINMKELSEEELERYKKEKNGEICSVCFIKNLIRGIVGYTSPDGLRWKELPTPIMMHFSDTLTIGTYDEYLKKYVGYFRMFYCGRRAIGRAETDDFLNWPLPEPILWPGSEEESPCNDYYTNSKTIYPNTTNTHFMFPAVYKRDTDSTEVRMYSSYDGIYWSKVPGEPVLRDGRVDEWDGGCLFISNGMFPFPDGRIAMPYIGYPVPHKYPRTVPLGELGFAVWEEGRLSALEAPEEGEFCTHPFICEGRELYINAETLKAGYVTVRVEDKNGSVIPGRDFSDNVSFTGNEKSALVSWNGETDIGAKEEQPVVFKFKMKAAKLYSFEVK